MVDKYLQSQCEGTGIAGLLGIHPNTLYRRCEEEFGIRFSEYSQQKKSEGKELLRAKQFQTAMKGDKTLLVWLGKQYLGQKDNHNGLTDDYPSPINVTFKVIDASKRAGTDDTTEQVP